MEFVEIDGACSVNEKLAQQLMDEMNYLEGKRYDPWTLQDIPAGANLNEYCGENIKMGAWGGKKGSF